MTRLPSRGPDGRLVYQQMRFIGVDGPRWFLRGVLTGPAAAEASMYFFERSRWAPSMQQLQVLQRQLYS